MYLDEGEELNLGSSRDHMLAFSAFTARANGTVNGQVDSHHVSTLHACTHGNFLKNYRNLLKLL